MINVVTPVLKCPGGRPAALLSASEALKRLLIVPTYCQRRKHFFAQCSIDAACRAKLLMKQFWLQMDIIASVVCRKDAIWELRGWLFHDNRCVSKMFGFQWTNQEGSVCNRARLCFTYCTVYRGNHILNSPSTPITCFCLSLVENDVSQN